MTVNRITQPVASKTTPRRTFNLDIAIDPSGLSLIGTNRCELEMSLGSIRDHNHQIINLMKRVETETVKEFEHSGTLKLERRFFSEILQDLRDAGLSALQSLGDQACEVIDRYEDKGEGLDVTIRARRFPLLWEFIYTGQPTGPVAPELFWGLHHQVSRFLIGADFLPEILDPAGGVLFCRNQVLEHWLMEMQKIQALAGSLRFALLDDFLETLDSDFDKLQDRIVHACTSGDFSFVHMASHVYPDPDDESVLGSQLALSYRDSTVEINLRHLNALRRNPTLRFAQNPLLFLNACRTMTNPEYLNQGESFPRSFLKLGAGAVVATACDIPDAFAMEFANKFYELFLGDTPLPASEALRQARWHFIKNHNNPLGLAYGLYAHNDLTVEW